MKIQPKTTTPQKSVKPNSAGKAKSIQESAAQRRERLRGLSMQELKNEPLKRGEVIPGYTVDHLLTEFKEDCLAKAKEHGITEKEVALIQKHWEKARGIPGPTALDRLFKEHREDCDKKAADKPFTRKDMDGVWAKIARDEKKA